jgi:hypothetical protein
VDFDITEITGEAGDVVLLHPFLLHARSKNLAPVSEHGVRFLCHPAVPLRYRPCFDMSCQDLSCLDVTYLDLSCLLHILLNDCARCKLFCLADAIKMV